MKLYVSAVSAACLALLPSLLTAAAPVPAPVPGYPSLPPKASYQFALAKLLAVEGSVEDAFAAFDEAEKLAPQSPETAYVLLEHGQLLARMAQYARNPSARDEALRKAADKVSAARLLAPANLDVLRAVGDVFLDLSASDPKALTAAQDALEEVRKRDPNDAQTFLTLGRIYLDQNQPDKAAAVFQELVNNVPQQRMAYALLVESLMRSNKQAEAEKALREILTFDPGSLEARLSLADLQSKRGDSKAVLESLRGAPDEVSDDPRLQRQLAWALYQNGDLEEAVALVNRLAGKDPDSTALVLLRGLIVAAQGNNEEAIGLLAKVQEAQPKDPGIALSLSRVMQRAGRRDEAAGVLIGLADSLQRDGKVKEAQEVRFEAAQVHFEGEQWEKVGEVLRPLLTAEDPAVRGQAVLVQADALSRAKRFDEALELLGREKESPAVASRRAEVLSRAGRKDEAARVFGELAGAGEASALAAAQGYQRLDRYPESIPILEKLAAANPDQVITGFLLGAAYERTGKRDQAITQFRKVIGLEPDFHAALNYLGYTFAESGTNLEEALDLVSRAVALDPDNGAYVDSLGWTYYRLGRPEQARGYLERAARLEPEDATLQVHLGDVYVALGQTERARQAYQRALDLGGDDDVDKVRRKLGDLDKPRP
ncbi:MAG TPA: tetratricopeptide repeat protein [Thermoanaerobaculia bacterium]|nr:tetratricopeptide repeat protein [Thermoanaerobaculia bacterium]